MPKQSFWKREIRFTYRFFAWTAVAAFGLSGLASGVFLNFIFPHLTSVPLLNLINPRLPVIVNKTEQVIVNESVNVRELYNRLKSVTVAVASYPGPLDPGKPGYRAPRVGSGIIVTTDGLIFTTKSVVENSKNTFYVFTSSAEGFRAELLAFDPKSSLAVLKIGAENLPLLSFGSADELAVADKLVSAGGSFSRYDQPAAETRVSQLPSMVTDRAVHFSERVTENFTVSPALSGVFTGAGLINHGGQIVGLSGDGQVLTGEYLQAALDLFLSQHNLTRAAFGARYVKITPAIGAMLKLPEVSGVLLASGDHEPAVAPGGAAAAAGLRAGDLIYKLDGETLDSRLSLEKFLDQKRPGEVLQIDFYRDGVPRTADVTLKAFP